MTFKLSDLPFEKNALLPFVSEETINFHYGQHHRIYVDNLNKLIVETEFEGKTLEEVIKTSSGPIFNNAAQAWNHTFYWNCLKKPSEENISSSLLAMINLNFGDVYTFKTEFTKVALNIFGSGWVWLVKAENKKLLITQTSNANNPITSGQIPLLVCDVWEHAYYIDYRNVRAKYLEAFWQILNWEFVEKNI